MSTRERIIRTIVGAVSVFVLVTGFSAVRFVLAHPGYSVQQNVATWARNKGMGAVVDRLEMWLHDTAPAAAPGSAKEPP